MSGPYQAPKPLPSPTITEIGPGLLLVNPLSRKGEGPGIFVVVEKTSSGLALDHGIPSPTRKWAEEGYTVVEITQDAFLNPSPNPFQAAQAALDEQTFYEPKHPTGIVCYSQRLWNQISKHLDGRKYVAAAVLYGDAASATSYSQLHVPLLRHLAGNSGTMAKKSETLKTYEYPEQSTSSFATPHQQYFDYAAEAVSHTRSLTFLKKYMNGPYFDLEDIWDEHTHWEFVGRSVENTMNTMVEEPYVNHIPTMTGGIGRKALTDFYTNHFIFSNPGDARLDLISRTIGVDRVVDEFIYCCTHDQTIDWLLPVVPPTGRQIEIPMMAVVNFRGDRLYHEHIHFDAATALKQVGAIPEYLAVQNMHNDRLEVEAPVAGQEGAAKLRDKNSANSNSMFGLKVRKTPAINGH